ncbi:DUF2232 domain-containing protein [Dichotomicrobium thermohalophilum]|uniref:Putative membrane protein DUF2232 n=1 Tax=Dichotomicrobium thermohalophilum TaxID=933063 RepID=A0A397Q5U7_9HYPH|nr:DUF2232 domain-containing protein [Dichotomicrobium thermohalophilum]RIA56472.1 putative membrane protein DUF2232 [Dichotomicrobium thermohalophilum]
MNNPAVIGALAGLVSALIFVSAATSAVAAALLVYITPLPLMIAGLGWGIRASLIGLGVGMLIAAALFSINVSLTYALMLAGPAALLVYLALLSRPEPQAPGGLAWYPPGRLIAWAALIAGAIGGGSAVVLAAGTGDYDTSVRQLFDETLLPALQQGEQELTEEQINQTVKFMGGILPGAVAAVWLLIMLINIWLGGKIASVSGRLIRPWPSLSDMEYPRFLPIAFLVALVGTMLFAGLTAAIASAFTGAILLAYLLMGLVVIHVITRGSTFQPLVLVLLYVGIVLVGWLGLLVALLGVAEPLLRLRQRAQERRDSSGPPDGPRPD